MIVHKSFRPDGHRWLTCQNDMAGEVAPAGHAKMRIEILYGDTCSVWLQDASICFTTASGNGT